MFGLNKVSELPDLQVFAAKSLHEKQADLPFDEELPPVGEPAIIPLEELEGAEKLEALDGGADPFFTRTSYNKTALNQAGLPGMEVEPAAQPPQEAPAQDKPAAEETDAASPVQETVSEKELEAQLTQQALEIETQPEEHAPAAGGAEEDK